MRVITEVQENGNVWVRVYDECGDKVIDLEVTQSGTTVIDDMYRNDIVFMSS